VTLLAVSKDVPAERLSAAVGAGLSLLGENRVQEAADKMPRVPGARWHLVGHLQSNKVGRAVELFEAVHSVDSLDLARRIDRLREPAGGPRYPVYLQVNVDADRAKQGFAPDELASALPDIVALEHLDVLGLMTVGRLVTDRGMARPTFVRLRELSTRLREREPTLGASLSMGMSDDFDVAVEEGATIVRVGRAIFGERPTDRR
jgi:pyridoxal phosphate enzyme (YggS family)